MYGDYYDDFGWEDVAEEEVSYYPEYYDNYYEGRQLPSIVVWGGLIMVLGFLLVWWSERNPTLADARATMRHYSDVQSVQVRMSWYNPALLGTNCGVVRNGKCVSNMASGLPWKPWMNRAVACPPEWPFWTQVIIDGRTYYCLDRGGKIKYVEGIPWVDVLAKKPLYPYGKIVTVQVQFPK